MEKSAKITTLRYIFSTLAVVVTLIMTGCLSVDNNYLSVEDFKVHLENGGVKVEGFRELSPEPFRATSGAAYMVAGSEIGVYKFDRTSEIQDKRIKQLKEKGRTYVVGIPYPIVVQGSFMFIGLEKNMKKQEILKVIKNFK